MLKNKIDERTKLLQGDYGIFYSNLLTGESFFVGNEDKFVAAGVIKLFILIEALRHVHEDPSHDFEVFKLSEADKAPSIGALTHLHEGIELHFSDLYKIMIGVSDNTAANMLLDRLGIQKINHTLRSIGMENCIIRRKFFDEEAIEVGLENTFSLTEVGKILERLYRGEIISVESCNKILDVMKLNQRDYVMSYYFKEKIDVAHQMGEEEVEGITHDVGIVFSDEPFVLCMATQNVNTTVAQAIMRDISLMCYEAKKND